MAVRFNTTRIQYLDESGDPYSGGLMNYYETGTSTRLDTYSDNALSSANANPVVADSAGRFGDIFLKGQDYKVVFTNSAGTTIWTADPVHGIITDRSVSAKTGTYTVTTADNGKLITGDASGGDFTITLPAAATAGGTFEVTIKNIGSSGTVTVDGDGSETIDGSTTLVLNHQYDSYLLRCDGTVWHTVIFLNKAAVLDGINDLTEDTAPDPSADWLVTYDDTASLAKKIQMRLAGSWVRIDSEEASTSASITLTGLDATYDTYVVIGDDLMPATDNVAAWLRLGDSSGVDSGASDYDWVNSDGMIASAEGTAVTAPQYNRDTDDAQIVIAQAAIGSAAGEGLSFVAFLAAHRGTGYPRIHGNLVSGDTSTQTRTGEFGGARKSTITTDRVYFQFSSGNIASGRLTVWGLSHV